jgi:hypothetical protein
MLIACVLILGRLSLQCPEILSYFTLQVWSKSILRIGLHSTPKYYHLPLLEMSTTPDLDLLASETEISDCIELFHIICTCVPLNPNLANCLIQNGVTEAILKMTLFVIMSAPFATIRQLLVGICHELLLYSEASQTVAIVEQIITFGWNNTYQLTDSGGLEIQRSHGEGGEKRRGLASFVRSEKDISMLGNSSEDGPEEDYMLLLREAILHQESLFLDPDSEGVDTNSTVTVVQRVMERTRSLCHLFVEISPEDKKTTSDSSLLQIPSQLFLRMLRGYLEIPPIRDDENGDASAVVDDIFVSLIPSHLCGIIMLVMKSHISLEVLLHDGELN